jgi:hypothetical protein
MPSALETKSMTGEVNGMTISPCPKITLLISLVVLPAARSGTAAPSPQVLLGSAYA